MLADSHGVHAGVIDNASVVHDQNAGVNDAGDKHGDMQAKEEFSNSRDVNDAPSSRSSPQAPLAAQAMEEFSKFTATHGVNNDVVENASVVHVDAQAMEEFSKFAAMHADKQGDKQATENVTSSVDVAALVKRHEV